jgi:tRNA (mo5U34)-methyltransferase
MSSSQVAQDFTARSMDFCERARQLGLGDVSTYYWYHTIDLGGGLVTPGIYDYRPTLPAFRFPEDMRGMAVLDVGSATGFFAFEFERRGARVLSVELPSLDYLDRLPWQSLEQTVEKIQHMLSSSGPEPRGVRLSPQELYWRLLEGPFEFCRKRLQSKVERCFATVYDLAEALRGRQFDLIFLGDILVHTLYPLRALAAVAPLCRGQLVLAQVLPESLEPLPAMLYVGGENPDQDDISWWWPNKTCFLEMLRKIGFRQAEVVGHYTGVLQHNGHLFDRRSILHALK